MNKVRIFLVGLILSTFITSCGTSKKVTETNKKDTPKNPKERVIPKTQKKEIAETTKTKEYSGVMSTEQYIEKYAEIAIEEMRTHKIPASITLAQGILESNSGNSDLTKKSNNHFGIKCHKKWQGERTYHDDDKKGECFRVYKDPSTSFKDHSRFLVNRKRYNDLFKMEISDYVSWAKGLKKAGYATDWRYAPKLINLIEKYELDKYDKDVLGYAFSRIIEDEKVCIVQKGDNLYRISKRSNLSIEDLKKINNLESDIIFVGQRLSLSSDENQLLSNKKDPSKTIIDKKQVKKKIDNPNVYIVKRGEGLYAVSKKTGINIGDLKRINGLKSNAIAVGQKLYLKEKDTVNIAAVSNKKHQMVTEQQPKKEIKLLIDNLKDDSSNKKEDKIVSSEIEILHPDQIKRNKELEKSRLKIEAKQKEITANREARLKEREALKKKIKEEREAKLKRINAKENKIENEVVQASKKPDTPLQKIVEEEVVQPVKVVVPKRVKPVKEDVVQSLKKVEKITASKANETVVKPVKEEKKKINNNNYAVTKVTPYYHIVKKGETLYQIAYKYNLEIPFLRSINKIKKNQVFIGQRLVLKNGAKTLNKKVNINQLTHTVVRGDTLFVIAEKYGLTVEKLKKLNNLKENTIFVGQVFIIK